MLGAIWLAVLLAVGSATPPSHAPLVDPITAFAAWASAFVADPHSAAGRIASGEALLHHRNAAVTAAVLAGDWAAVLNAARSLPPLVRAGLPASLPLPDAWVSALVNVDTRICAPLRIAVGSAMHIEHHVTFSPVEGPAAVAPLITLPLRSVEMVVPGRSWHDSVGLQASGATGRAFTAAARMVVSHDMVPALGVFWGAAAAAGSDSAAAANGPGASAFDGEAESPSHSHASNPAHVGRPVFILAEGLAECTATVPAAATTRKTTGRGGNSSSDSGGPATALNCIVGGTSSSFPSADAAEAWAADHFHRSSAARMSALGLRPAGHWREARLRKPPAPASGTPEQQQAHGGGRGLAADVDGAGEGPWEEGLFGGPGATDASPSSGVAAATASTLIDPMLAAAAATAAVGTLPAYRAEPSDEEGGGQDPSGARRLGLPASYTVGNRAMLAVRLAFQDAPTNTITLPNSLTIMNAVTAYFSRMSFGTVAITLTLPASIYVIPYNASSSPSAGTIASSAAAVLTAAGYNPSNYQHFVMLWPWMGW